MTRMLVAGVMSTMFVIALGPWFIRWLQRKEFGQNVRDDGPQGHILSKAGTPTMGGLFIVLAMSVPFWLFGRHTVFGLTVWLVMVACALVGFADDWLKISNRRSLGLSGRWKMLSLGLIAVALTYVGTTYLGLTTELELPLSGTHIDFAALPDIPIPGLSEPLDLGLPLFYLFAFLVLAGAANAVNLTDGLDGLAAGTVVISLLSFIGISFITGDRAVVARGVEAEGVRCAMLPFEYVERFAPCSFDLAIFAAALAGACVGFLWYNSFPAHVFMGDTGSIALGGALAALALLTKNELLLVIIGGIFVVEAISVMLQVLFFKRTGRRVFLMAPIHHHFELKAWSETQIMVRFWIVAGLFASTGFTIWFRTH